MNIVAGLLRQCVNIMEIVDTLLNQRIKDNKIHGCILSKDIYIYI
jgi:hypothetical protein